VFVAPHAPDDAVRELAFVRTSDFSAGLAFCGFAREIAARVGMVALLG
jgi:hypothetical protein